ncbi:ORF6C domain-containing protein, partial [Pseudomonas aeruginosa]
MSKELNKAPVEQAGGDERAAFEAWLAQAMSHKFDPEFDLAKYEDSGEYRYNPAAAYWKAWQARAALAQPSPV